jgi:hypothetical protein
MPDDFIVTSRPPSVHFDVVGSVSPATLYIGPGEELRIRVSSSVVGAYIKISSRILLADGTIVPVEDTVFPTSDRVANVWQFGLPEGFLLGFRMRPFIGIPTGRVFGSAMIVKGGVLTTTVLQQLTSGYMSDNRELTWPLGTSDAPRAGPGWIRSIVGTNPAAGSEISETVPTNAYWRIQSILFNFVSDATVINRHVRLVFDDGTNNMLSVEPNATQAASLNYYYNYGHGLPYKAVLSGYPVNPLPDDLILAPGWRFRTTTSFIQAGDDYGAPNFTVEEWIEL